ncbi:sugar phosphate isomerase/epimerase family protein [Parabacteroides pacaensis]|uniref:sugar phosphate isomerase/epimerase family protein n=1 Tax=Parabacteroides pacaensis TaxID=2086575 RepID=UPI000D109802|nr:sugar phosphate isomerase/epimerase family protein [Parabacteroides pacaensis]
MKLSIAIASENALASAFVVFRGFESSILKAAQLGYNGVELALKNAGEIDRNTLQPLLDDTGMQVSCISTGQVYADTGLMFTDTDTRKRKQVKNIFQDLIDLAADFKCPVNVGRIRGQVGKESSCAAEERFLELMHELCEYAAERKVGLLLEPVNRYEIDFINSIREGVQLLKKVNHPSLKLMPDLFHMNIEEVKMGEELARYIRDIGYIHLADSNRLAPGWGHTDFKDVFLHLEQAHYTGWLSVEILPKPAPFVAAKQAIDFLKPFFSLSTSV